MSNINKEILMIHNPQKALDTKEDFSIDLERIRQELDKCCDPVLDPRKQDNLTYSFSAIIGTILCAVIGGANTVTAIFDYAKIKHEWLKKWLPLPEQAPGFQVFWWILTRLDPKHMENIFRNWISSLKPEDLKGIIAIDGKRIKGASKGKTSQGLVHIVSAWSSSRGLILGQIKTDEKSNEITAIPELISGLDISGATVTIDAMGCQKKIASDIIEKGGNYVLALKGNQESICDEVSNFFEQASAINFEEVSHDAEYTVDKGHGRIEERTVYVSDDLDWLPMKEEWKGLRSIVMIESTRSMNEKTSKEIRYYLASLEADATQVSKAVRKHWGIENKVHWTLDVVYKEDESQLSTGHAAENMSIFKRLAMNILNLDNDKKISLASKRRRAGWSDDYMAELLLKGSVKSF